jgi:hypothetical protein
MTITSFFRTVRSAFSLDARPNPSSQVRIYPAAIRINRNRSELGTDVSVQIGLGRIDSQGEVFLASGVQCRALKLRMMNPESSDSGIICGNILWVTATGPALGFGMRFRRASEGDMQILRNIKEGQRYDLAFAFNSIASAPATRFQRKELRLPWYASSPRIHSRWDLLAIWLIPNDRPRARHRDARRLLTIDPTTKPTNGSA